MKKLNSLGLSLRPGSEDAKSQAQVVGEWGKKHNISVFLDEDFGEEILNCKKIPAQEMINKVDLLITLGGDGTLLGIARLLKGKSPPVLGVHFGKLGFLTEFLPEELIPTLDKLYKGEDLRLGWRNMFSCTVERGGDIVFSSEALNDIILQRGARDRLLEIALTVDSEPMMIIRADGLIIATPTGSTAYSLAAGGSIVEPSLEVMLLTPLCPHSLTMRPMVLSLDRVLEIVVPPYDGKIFLTADGQSNLQIVEGDRILVKRSPNRVGILKHPSRTYYDLLRNKLSWGVSPIQSSQT